MDDLRYVILKGFVDEKLGYRDFFKPVAIRKEVVIKAAMDLITKHLVDQIMQENETVD